PRESDATPSAGRAGPGAALGPRSSTAESPRCKPSTPRKTRRFNGAAVIDRGKPPVQIQCGFGVLATGLRARRDGGVESAVAWMCTGGRVVYLCWVFKELCRLRAVPGVCMEPGRSRQDGQLGYRDTGSAQELGERADLRRQRVGDYTTTGPSSGIVWALPIAEIARLARPVAGPTLMNRTWSAPLSMMSSRSDCNSVRSCALRLH